MYDDYEHLRFAQSGKILTVTLDHPPMNAVNRKLHGELARVFWQINRDSSVAVVVVTGAGDRAFSAGGDLNAMKKRLDEGEHASWTNTIWEAREILQSVLGLEKPLIARINGHAMGLGATLAVLADFSYMVRTAKIADSHVKVGLSPGDGGALLWPILMGFAKARLHLMTGEPLTGEEAASAGLITEAFDDLAALDAKVESMSNLLARSANRAVNSAKITINAVLMNLIGPVMSQSLAQETNTYLTDDHREAVNAFLEKSEPRFEGR